jgi:serine/threonine protein kinase
LDQRIDREVNILGQLDHPNIISFLGTAVGLLPGIEHRAIILPWFRNGDAASYIKTNPNVDKIKLVI